MAVNKLALIGALLGGSAGIFLLGQAFAAGPSLETIIPGLLALAFAGIGGWGGAAAPANPKRQLRAVLGAAAGGLVSADLFYIPAALAFLAAAYFNWRSK